MTEKRSTEKVARTYPRDLVGDIEFGLLNKHHYLSLKPGTKPDDPGWHSCRCGDWEGYWSGYHRHVAEVIAEWHATRVAAAEAEADTHREVAESMTKLWQDERDRADRLEAMCDRLAERLAELSSMWHDEGRGVMFNRAGDDLTPQQRVGKWLVEKTAPSRNIRTAQEGADRD